MQRHAHALRPHTLHTAQRNRMPSCITISRASHPSHPTQGICCIHPAVRVLLFALLRVAKDWQQHHAGGLFASQVRGGAGAGHLWQARGSRCSCRCSAGPPAATVQLSRCHCATHFPKTTTHYPAAAHRGLESHGLKAICSGAVDTTIADALDMLGCCDCVTNNLLDCVVSDMYGECAPRCRATAPMRAAPAGYHVASGQRAACRTRLQRCTFVSSKHSRLMPALPRRQAAIATR